MGPEQSAGGVGESRRQVREGLLGLAKESGFEPKCDGKRSRGVILFDVSL